MRRFPWATAMLFLAAASLCFGPRFVLPVVLPGAGGGSWESFQHVALLLALLLNSATYGRQPGVVPWPALVVSVMLLVGPAYGVLVPIEGLTAGQRAGQALSAWMVLSLPWLAVVPRLQPGSTRYYTRLLASLAVLSTVLGLLLHLLTDWQSFRVWHGMLYRLAGATRADYFAALAFGGVVIAVHEWSRRGARSMGLLAAVNGILLIYSGSRTALIATGVWLASYLVFSRGVHSRLSALRPGLWFVIVSVGAALLLHFPVLRHRMSGIREGHVNLSGRGTIWEAFFGYFQARPWFGMGLGAAQPGVLHRLLPHDEYLRLLVEIGIFGALLYLGAVLLWIRQVARQLRDEDRPYLLALVIALPLYALTDNPISACYVTPFLYLGTLMPDGPDAT